jgi:serine/threonine protein kinase
MPLRPSTPMMRYQSARILDFGLAKAFADETQSIDSSQSPTVTEAMTRPGMILGTAAYMSPEQARGKPVDKRADIWAFGCLLYEMLSGQAAFRGDDVTEILAAVVKSDADMGLLPANIHPKVHEILARCLQKDQRDRYRDIGDVRYEIKQILGDPRGVFFQHAAAAKPRKKSRQILLWAAVTVVLLIITGIAIWNLREPKLSQVVRLDHVLPENQQLNIDLGFPGQTLAVSADGSQFAYSTSDGLYLRPIDSLEAKLIQGTEKDNPQSPFFSPNGK